MTQAPSRTARNAAAVVVSTLVAQVVQFGWVILLGQLLSAADFGTWGVIGGMIAIAATLPEFGMGIVALRDVAQRPRLAGRYLAATLIVQPLLAFMGYALLVASGVLIYDDAGTRILLTLAALSLIIDTLGNMCHNQLLAAEEMVATSSIRVTHITLQVVFGVTAMLSGGGLPGVYLATIAAGLFRVAMYWWAVRRIGLHPEFPVRRMIVGRLFREGWAIALGSFLQLAYQNLDKIIVSVALSKAETAYLTAAVVIVFGVVELTNTALLVALFPAMSRLAGENPRLLLRMVDNFAFLTLVITLPLGVGISLLADTLAGLFFPRFVGTAAVLSILIWQGVVSMIAGIYTQSLYVRGKQRTQLLIRVCGLVINGVANLILIPALGVRGAAFAALLAQSTVLALCLFEHRTLMLAARSARAIIAAACMAAVMFALRDVLHDIQFMLAGMAGVLVYAAVLLALRTLAPEHWGVLRTIGSALPLVGRVIMRWS